MATDMRAVSLAIILFVLNVSPAAAPVVPEEPSNILQPKSTHVCTPVVQTSSILTTITGSISWSIQAIQFSSITFSFGDRIETGAEFVVSLSPPYFFQGGAGFEKYRQRVTFFEPNDRSYILSNGVLKDLFLEVNYTVKREYPATISFSSPDTFQRFHLEMICTMVSE